MWKLQGVWDEGSCSVDSVPGVDSVPVLDSVLGVDSVLVVRRGRQCDDELVPHQKVLLTLTRDVMTGRFDAAGDGECRLIVGWKYMEITCDKCVK